MRFLEQLHRFELVVVTGKGGVGKTTVAAVLGRYLAALGHPTAVMEADPRESVHQMLDQPPSGGELLAVDSDLWVQNVQPRTVVDRLVRRRVRPEWVTDRVLASTIYEHFVAGAPGLAELALLGHALELVRGDLGEGEPSVKTVVFDAPATGHGLSLLTAPQLVAEVVTSGPVAELTARVDRWVQDEGAVAVVATTTAEEMPVNEVLQLAGDVTEALGRSPIGLVVNALYPRVAAGGSGSPATDPARVLLRQRRRINEHQLWRLRREWKGESVELPLVPLDRGVELCERLVRELSGRP